MLQKLFKPFFIKTIMKVSKAGIAGIIIVIVLVGIVIAYAIPKTPQGDYDTFAQCVTDAGAKMYGAFWCSHCQNQKKSFGASWEHINYVECSTADGKSQLPVCTAAGIQGYPTWVFADGSRIEGEASFAQLAGKTGCSLQ